MPRAATSFAAALRAAPRAALRTATVRERAPQPTPDSTSPTRRTLLFLLPSALLANPDRKPFQAWFTWLAEALYHLPEDRRPREISDCSALLRFCYREAQRPHTAQWARDLGLDWMPPLPELKHPTRDSSLFRVASGDLRQFADAEHLMRFNTRLITRDIQLARPADLLFYRQLVPNQPWHSMIFLGPSAFETLAGPCVVYHTGPSRRDRGEIRRPTLSQLLEHPEPRWRPVAGNGNFLGVFRWNLLCESD